MEGLAEELQVAWNLALDELCMTGSKGLFTRLMIDPQHRVLWRSLCI